MSTESRRPTEAQAAARAAAAERLKAWRESHKEEAAARLVEARAKAAETRDLRTAAQQARFAEWLETQAAEFRQDREAPRRVRYSGRCDLCGAFLPMFDMREEVSAHRSEEHGAGVCAREEKAATRRREATEKRRVKQSRTLAHRAAVMGISVTGGGQADE